MLTVRIPVADPDSLLDEFGVGALLRLESSDAEEGIYELLEATAALVSGLFEYYLVDPDGTPALWYRWRAGTAEAIDPEDFGPYSEPFLAGGPYLTVDQFRALAPSSLDDASLRILLDAAAQDIVRAAGQPGPVTEQRHARGPILSLSRSALAVTEIVDGVVIDSGSYTLSSTGDTVRRTTGRWRAPVVTFVPRDDTATRQRVQAELVKLDISFTPGLASQTIGTWTEAYTDPSAGTLEQQRDAILAGLVEFIGF